jgi:hypothetical protein
MLRHSVTFDRFEEIYHVFLPPPFLSFVFSLIYNIQIHIIIVTCITAQSFIKVRQKVTTYFKILAYNAKVNSKFNLFSRCVMNFDAVSS